jgi:hypothetical protein
MNRTLGIIIGVIVIVAVVVLIAITYTGKKQPEPVEEMDPKLKALMELKTSNASMEERVEAIQETQVGGTKMTEEEKLRALQSLQTK